MKIIEKEFNAITGQETITERDETPAETKARLDCENEVAEKQAKAAAKAHEKSALLAKLGITEDEAKLLLS
jgi:hypothetical protein